MNQFDFNTIGKFVQNSMVLLLVFCFSTSLGAAGLRVVPGTGEAGFVDGTDAQFNKPIRLAPFGPGRVLVADINNHAIPSMTIDGEVLKLAGGPDHEQLNKPAAVT
jgi:hypothetical protein